MVFEDTEEVELLVLNHVANSLLRPRLVWENL